MAKVTFIESATTSTGKPYKKVSLDTEVLGKNKFNVFSFHTRYADVVVGRAFDEGEFEQDGQYIKLRDPDAGIKRGFGGGKSRGPDPMVIAQAQENKAKQIGVAQDNKDYSIRLSGSMGHAVNVVTTFYETQPLTPEEIKTKILNWRGWFMDNWEIEKPDAGEIPF